MSNLLDSHDPSTSGGGDDAAVVGRVLNRDPAQLPPPVVVPTTHDRVGALVVPGSGRSLADLYPDATFSDPADPTLLGKGVIAIDDYVEVSPQFLLNLPDETRGALVGAASDPDGEKGTLTDLAKSGNLRMRFPFHADEAKAFLDRLAGRDAVLVDGLAAVWNNATQEQKYRAYDLKSGHATALPGAPNRNKQAMAFTARMDPQNVNEFVEYFEFYHAWCDDQATDVADSLIKDAQARGEVLGKAALKKLRSRARDVVDNRVGGASPTTDALNDVADDYEMLQDAVNALWPPGPAGFGGGATPADRRNNIRGAAANLKMPSVPAAVYHVKKHLPELTRAERDLGVGDNAWEQSVDAYRRAAQGAITGDLADKSPQPGQFGGEAHFYKRSMQSIVRTNDLANAIIATCFKG